MTRYRVKAVRSGKWWALEFPDVDERIHSQARRLGQVRAMSAEAISFALEVDVKPEDVDVEFELDSALDRTVKNARRHRAVAEQASREAARSTRVAVRSALDAGLSVRDVGELLGVSFQYVSQVAKGERPPSDGLVPRRAAKVTTSPSGNAAR